MRDPVRFTTALHSHVTNCIRALYSLAALCLCAAFASCGESSGLKDGLGPPGFTVVAGTGQTDTVNASLQQALVVEVRDTHGRIVPESTVVRFTSVLANGSYELWPGPIDQAFFSPLVSVRTNREGKALALLRFGQKSGTQRLVVSVPEFGFVDTIAMVAAPGKAKAVSVTPEDTAVYVGASYQMYGWVVDAYGNVRNDPVSFSGPGVAGFTVSVAGAANAAAVGRYAFTAHTATLVDSVSVSVVPQLQLAAVVGCCGSSSVVIQGLDGSGRQTLAAAPDGGIGVHPSWMPGPTRVIFTTAEGDFQVMKTATTTTVAPFFKALPLTMSHTAQPVPSSDGTWLYFISFDSRCSTDDYCLSRSLIDGSGVEVLTAAGVGSMQPAPSPDGSLVAFSKGGVIQVLNPSDGTLSSWSVNGARPRWSPDGAKIAFIAGGRIALMDPDGTNAAALTVPSRLYSSQPISWSPDGKWIVARTQDAGVIDLVEVATGNYLPLVHTADLGWPSIK